MRSPAPSPSAVRLAIAGLVLSLPAPIAAGPDPGYPWLDDASGPTLETRFEPPAGYSRGPAEGFPAWLRGLPVVPDRIAVLAHDGRELDRPAAAIVRLDVGRGDLQQCADSVIRLHAEYLWASGHAEAAAYHFTSGDRSAWTDWRDGERFAVSGSRVDRVRGEPSSGRVGYRAWLQHLFRYAGTRSLRLDTDAVPSGSALRAGDVFVEPGSPGHAVLLLDVAEDTAGHRVALVGQGFMPAEEFHVVRSERALDGVWFRLPDDGETLVTPSWRPFQRAHARRFR